MDKDKCPIWGTPANIREIADLIYEVESPRAGGTYRITREACEDMPAMIRTDEDRMRLTQEVVENIASKSDLLITSTTLEVIPRKQAWAHMKRAEWLLRFLAGESSTIGQRLSCSANPEDTTTQTMFAWSGSTEIYEVIYLFDALHERGHIKKESKGTMGVAQTVIVGLAGFAFLEETHQNVESDQAFIAMWFDESMQELYEKGIEKAVREAGYRPVRIDTIEHNNKICDEIIAAIKQSRFVVADFSCGTFEIQDAKGESETKSEARGGVYYEAGFAQGLDIQVIWTCHEDSIDFVHFDTRQYNHIVWSSPEDLCKRLKARIKAVIGIGPHT